MLAEGLQGHRALGGETMRITVIGALEIAAIVLAAVLLVWYLQKHPKPGAQPGQPQEPNKPNEANLAD
jgi:hypothetical protein